MALEDASRGARTVLTFGLNESSGLPVYPPDGSVSSYTAFPIYNARTPIQADIGVLELDRAKNSLGPDSLASGITTYTHEFSTYLYGNATSTRETCTDLFTVCGLGQGKTGGSINGGPISITGAGPTITTAAASSGAGNLTGTYTYKLVKVTTATGEKTFGGATKSVTGTVSAKNVDLAFTAAGAGYTYELFRTVAGGSVHYFLTTIATDAITYVDGLADTYLDYSYIAPAYSSADTEVQYQWEPISDTFSNGAFKYYLNGEMRHATGSRGTFSVSQSYGQQAEVRWSLRGLYNAASATANASGACDPGMPPKAESCSAYLIPQSTGSAISPLRFKTVGYDHGAIPTIRGDLNAASSGVLEIGLIQRFGSRVMMTVEKRSDGGYDPVAAMVAGTRYAGGWQMGSGLYGRWAFDFPKLQLASAPRETLVEDDVRAWELEFRPIDGWDVYQSGYASAATCLDNRWVRIRRF